MAAFRNNSFFNNRFNQNNHNHMGQMGQNFNAPRGTFPQNFGSYPQVHQARGNPHAANFHTQNPHFQPQPQHMPRPSQQPIPPRHPLNPNNDPHVRFEPVPPDLQGSLPALPAQPPQAPAPQGNDPAPSKINEATIAKLLDLAQGEENSIAYYNNLSKSPGLTEKDKHLLHELIENKKRQVQNASTLYKNITKTDWPQKDMQTERPSNFRSALSYALLQESKLLRETSLIYEELTDHQQAMLPLLHNKIADIAHLMAMRP